jgi:hypothetical protein
MTNAYESTASATTGWSVYSTLRSLSQRSAAEWAPRPRERTQTSLASAQGLAKSPAGDRPSSRWIKGVSVGAMLGARDHDVTAPGVTRRLLDGADQLPADSLTTRRPAYRERRKMRDRFGVMDWMGNLNGRECVNDSIHHGDKDPSVSYRREPGEPLRKMRRQHRIAELRQQLREGLGVRTGRLTNLESHSGQAQRISSQRQRNAHLSNASAV